MTPIRLDEITPSSVWRVRRVRAASWWLRTVRPIWGASATRSSTYAARAGLSRVSDTSATAPSRGWWGVPSGTATPPASSIRRWKAPAGPPWSARRASRSISPGSETMRGQTTGPSASSAASPSPIGSSPSGVSSGASACAAGEGPTQ